MSPPSSSSWSVDAGHRLYGARQLESPHCDARPDADDISLLVIHGISLPPGEFGGPWIDALFLGQLDPHAHPYFEEIRGLRVSAHCCIARDGVLTQYVPFDRRAWHAGVSQWQGRERCNDFSIGIELEGCDTLAYTDAQYQQLTQLARALLHHYPRLHPTGIVGHSDIAPGRKTDPGPAFDWARFRTTLEASA